MPKPNPNETREEYIERFMSSEEAKKDYPEKDQRLAVANSMWKEHHKSSKKESMFCRVFGMETKSVDNGDFVKGGYIATSHLDSGFYDESRKVWVKDRIPKNTLDSWAELIKMGNPRANKVSVHHEREREPAGKGIEGSARVDILPDGEYGLYVDTLFDRTKSSFNDTKYKIDKGFIDSFSIEFTTRDPLTGDYIPGAVKEERVSNGIVRTLLPNTILEGWTVASQPMNEYAIMIKEIRTGVIEKELNRTKNNDTPMEDNTMTENKEDQPASDPASVEPVSEKVEEKQISASDLALLKEYKEMKAQEENKQRFNEIKESIKNELKEELKKAPIENKVMANKTPECKEFMEYKEAIKSDSKLSVSEQFRIAGKMAEKLGFITSDGIKTDSKSIFNREYKMSTNGARIEFKGLGITTNQNTDTDYLLSAAELADVFDPVIYNALNQQTVTWNLLPKDDFSNKGNNQVQFTLKTAANTTAAFYTGNAINTGNVTRLKFQTKFKKAQVGVEIDGDMMAAARGGPIGDVFAKEVQDSADDLMAVLNAALFAEVGLETASGVIGFEYICDSAGNTILYNLTRSTTNKLAPASAGNTYINGSSADISLSNLRAMKRNAFEEGAALGNVVFITSPIQADKFRGIYDALQRLVPTSSRFGFEGRPEFDGIPIFEDKDCNDDDWFLVDLETHRVAMWVPPTLEILGKDADSQKGFIKTYFAVYNRAPRRMSMCYGNATS